MSGTAQKLWYFLVKFLQLYDVDVNYKLVTLAHWGRYIYIISTSISSIPQYVFLEIGIGRLLAQSFYMNAMQPSKALFYSKYQRLSIYYLKANW